MSVDEFREELLRNKKAVPSPELAAEMKHLLKEKRVPPKVYYLKNGETQMRDKYNAIITSASNEVGRREADNYDRSCSVVKNKLELTPARNFQSSQIVSRNLRDMEEVKELSARKVENDLEDEIDLLGELLSERISTKPKIPETKVKKSVIQLDKVLEEAKSIHEEKIETESNINGRELESESMKSLKEKVIAGAANEIKTEEYEHTESSKVQHAAVKECNKEDIKMQVSFEIQEDKQHSLMNENTLHNQAMEESKGIAITKKGNSINDSELIFVQSEIHAQSFNNSKSKAKRKKYSEAIPKCQCLIPVSYTHLTLPTIYSV
eukprot:TRINITY_DN860_c0_g2_i4.p1 TRINITY_DN860_c0_g2~~TRINITY_DN860_c0_g2_i4.p1  ORF type:complete len:322 (+),score=89.01 TRINITY_DN860_c0_g2_i4:1240-2205(+)